MPIFKRKDPAVYTNYRPISLLDVFSKTLKTQIARHITSKSLQTASYQINISPEALEHGSGMHSTS
jgi:hypothetical protein